MDLLRIYADQIHHKKEGDILFEALKSLVKIIQSDESIKEVRATSIIVVRIPNLMEGKLGF